MRRSTIMIGSLLLVAVIAALFFATGDKGGLSPSLKSPQPVASLRFAVITHPYSTLIAVAEGKGFFKAEGIEATIHPHAAGKEGIKAVVEGTADVTTAADTGLAEALLKGAPLRIAAVVGSSDASHQIIARRDLGITKASDLRGKKIGVTFGTFGDFCLDTFLTLNRIPAEAITKVDIKPGEMTSALLSGRVDAVSSWEPITTALAERLGSKAVELLNSPPVSTSHSLIVHEELAKRNPLLIERMTRALLQAEQFTKEHPEESQAIAARTLGIDQKLLTRIWSHYSFNVMLDQDLIVRLEEQARWLMERDGSHGGVPNLLHYFHFAALDAVAPGAVTLIHK
jgi:ABC-type nitrate/sulfonate/bicarbonate transport system substrate-binding protein